MITVYRWTSGSRTSQLLDACFLESQPAELRESELLWIDLADPSEEQETLVFQKFFQVHPLTLEDITRLRRFPTRAPHFPKAEEFPDYLLVIVNPLASGFLEEVQGKGSQHIEEYEQAATQLSIVVASKLLITHHYQDIAAVDQLRAFLARHEVPPDRGPDYLCHVILDGTVDQYALALDHFDAALDDAELKIFGKGQQ